METLKKDIKSSFLQLASDIEVNLETIREESKACSKITLDAIGEVFKKIGNSQTSSSTSPPTQSAGASVPPSASLPKVAPSVHCKTKDIVCL